MVKSYDQLGFKVRATSVRLKTVPSKACMALSPMVLNEWK